MKRTARLLLGDMIEFSNSIVTLLGDMDFDQFNEDMRTHEAITSLIIKFGEASTVLMDDYPQLITDFPEIPLVSARRMRNKLVHGYWRSDLMVVYMTAMTDMPAVRDHLKSALGAVEKYEQAP